MTENLLRYETSPYLLQHRGNPVHWRGWNEAALAEAQRLDRPILLSIGYAACHWCHVMAHESFEDEDTAAVMNRLYVNIKVDREERPDIDQIYMAALHALGDAGGWPLTMFLTPDARPIWGGTYFPKHARYGRPAFADVLTQIAGLYRNDRQAIVSQSGRIAAHLAKSRRPDRAAHTLTPAMLDQAADAILGIMDPVHGGTKGAPKFPNAPALDFLARSAERTGRQDLRQIVDTTLIGLCNGGIFDHVGGGFARYSTDAIWLVPHFEKMLSDNGLLIEQLARASTVSTSAPLFRDRIEATIDWLLREMLLPGGAFSASLDADSDGGEGRNYVWDRQELDEWLTAADAGFIATLYDIEPEGNWEGRSIPNRLKPHPPLTPAEDVRRKHLLATLEKARATRPKPGLDDKILVDWNAFAIAGLTTAGLYLDRPEWIEIAEQAFRFVSESVSSYGRLGHALRDGKRVHPGFSSDIAAMARAAALLFEATSKPGYLEMAGRTLDTLQAHHDDGTGGYYFTADDAEALILRKNDRHDDAVPNAHGLAVDALVRLWSLTGEDRYREHADAVLESSAGEMSANVFGAASLLAAFDLRLRVGSVLIIVPLGGDASALRRVVLEAGRSNVTLMVREEADALPSAHPAHGKRAIDGLPTAYLCREGSCSLPMTDPDALRSRILAETPGA